MELQEAIERFLSDTERRRSDVTVKRYGEAMELLQSYLALELIDPDAPGESTGGSVKDVTPEAISAFINEFLGNRLLSNDRARKRYVAATRSFVQWLSRSHLLAEESGEQILEVLRQATRGLSRGEDGQGASTNGGPSPLALVGGAQVRSNAEDERYFQVLENQGKAIVLLDLETADEVRGDAPFGEDLQVGDLVAGALTRKHDRPWVEAVRLVAGDDDDGEGDELGIEDEWDDEGDVFGEDDDDWAVSSGPMVEDALEILASEDRYAPREVVRVILADIDTARDDLLEWLMDDDYRNEPFPGAGEAPANAARLLSEVRDVDALPRLLAVLGDTDPLGEEAPSAIARYGHPSVGPLTEVLGDPEARISRRIAALWSLAILVARNPAVRLDVGGIFLRALTDAPEELATEALSALEELRLVEVQHEVVASAERGELNLEALDRTRELFESRIRDEGWGERVAEGMLPVLYLYPTGEELEEFYESLEEDLGDLWELMGIDDDDHDELDDDSDEDDDDGPPHGGKVIPFRRPKP
ncbi:MAG: hypothetical protein ABI333_14690 [bacterium]